MRVTGMHKCAIPGCEQVISKRLLMCSVHWKRLSAPMQREVNRTFTAYLKADGLFAEGYTEIVRTMREAQQRAVREVEGIRFGGEDHAAR